MTLQPLYSLLLLTYIYLGVAQDDDCPIDPSKENESSLIAGIIIIYAISLTFAIVLIIYLTKFYQNRVDPNIENRHPRLVYATVSIVIFTNIVLFPLAIEFWTLECVTHTRWLRKEALNVWKSPLESFLYVTFIVVLLGWLILVVLRVWLLRYDYGASLARKCQIWKKDLGIAGGSSTWWINHQQTWGKETYLMKIVAIPYLIAVILSIMVSPIFYSLHQIEGWTAMTSTVGAISIILCGFIVVNVWKVREIHDNFHIKHEVLLFAKSSMVIASVLLVAFLISLTSRAISAYIVLIWGILVMMLLTTVSYIQTGWVLYGIRRKNEKSEKLVKSINDEWESNISLSTVLESKEGFEIFMDFLVGEYSTENLLCYVEATQFLRKWKYVIYKMKTITNSKKSKNKSIDPLELVDLATKYVQKQISKDGDNDDSVDNQPWSFHDKESILIKFQWVKKPPVMKQDDITIWDHFKHLRQKYISATSAHQVNIRSALYKHYTTIKKEECTLVTLEINDVLIDIEQVSPRGIQEKKSLSNVSGSLSDYNGEFVSLQHSQKGANKIESLGDLEIQRSQTGQMIRNLKHLDGVAKVLQLIEDTRKELWKNMNDSFVRFRSTESYVNYIKKLYINRDKRIDTSGDDSIIYMNINME